MPTDTAIVIGVILFVFVGFAATMAWADHYSSSARHTDRSDRVG